MIEKLLYAVNRAEMSLANVTALNIKNGRKEHISNQIAKKLVRSPTIDF